MKVEVLADLARAGDSSSGLILTCLRFSTDLIGAHETKTKSRTMRSLYMKTLFAIILIITAPALICTAEVITIPETSISFNVPADFKPLSQEIIDIKYPSSRAPRYVIGNESASTTIAYDLKPYKIPQDKLGEVQKSFTELFSRIIPGIRWKKNEIITKAGTKWLYLEMTSNAIDTDIYNMMLLTGYKDQMVIFNFNSTKEDFPQYEAQLRQSMDSISISPEKSDQNE